MLRIWSLGRALGLLAPSMPSGTQALSTDISPSSTHTIFTTVTAPPVERSVPIFIAAERPSVNTVWVEETVTVTVTVDVLPTTSSTSQHSWTTVTAPCLDVDDTNFMKPTLSGRAILEMEPDVSTVWVEETVYSTVTVDVLPTTSSTLHDDDDDRIMKPTPPPGRRAVIVRQPAVSTVIQEVNVTTEEIVYVTISYCSSVGLDLNSMLGNYNPSSTFTIATDSSSMGLDLNSMIGNYNPLSTYAVEEPAPPPTTTSVSSTTHEELTTYLPTPTTSVPSPSTLNLTFTSTMKSEDVPGYWLKGGIVSTKGHAVHRRHEEASSVTTDYTHDVHPTVQASQWLGRFRNFARQEATTKRSTCVSTIPTLAAVPASCSTSDVEERLAFENSLTKSNEAREWLRRLVQRQLTSTSTGIQFETRPVGTIPEGPGFVTAAEIVSYSDGKPMHTILTTWTQFRTSTIGTAPGDNAQPSIAYAIISYSDGKPEATQVSFGSIGTTPTTATRTTSLSATPSLETSTLLQETTLTSRSRSTTIWPNSATSWSPSPTATSALEWDWWKGTRFQKTISAKKGVRSAAAAVEQKVEMSGWRRAENSVNPWVITSGFVLAGLTIAAW